jgi:hypothetical protein
MPIGTVLLALLKGLLEALGILAFIRAQLVAVGLLTDDTNAAANAALKQAADARTILYDADHGMVALHNQLTAITALLGDGIPGVLSAIAALPAGSDIVIPASSANAEAVWTYQDYYRDQMGNMLSKLDETNFKLGPRAGYLAPATPWFGLYDPTTFVD